MEQRRAKRRHGAVIAAALIGLGFTLLCFWPGYMSEDSISQLTQARSADYDPWHPPAMSWVWRTVDRVAPGPGGMLALHSLLFWSGLALVAGRTIERPAAAFAAVLAIGLLPPVFGLLSTIWKDVALGVSLIVGFALLLVAHERRSLAAVFLALPFLCYAAAVRYNGAAAVLPLALWGGSVLSASLPPRWRRRRTSVAVGGLLFAAVVVVAVALNGWLAGGRTPRSMRVLFVQDMAAIAIASHERIPPPSPVEESAPAIMARWRDAIARHPGAYLRYRTQAYARLLGVGPPAVCYPLQERSVTPNPFVPDAPPTALNRRVTAVLGAVKNGPLFRAWIYFALVLVLPAVAWLHGSDRRVAATVLGASGLLYIVPYFVIAPDCDFRYSWWTVLATLLLSLVVFGRATAAEPR